MLDQIKAALEAIEPHVCYGTDRALEGTEVWDYIVFRRTRTAVQPRAPRGDVTDYYEINLVRADYVPEDEALRVLDALTSLPGLKPVAGDISYTAVSKPGTKAQLEVATFSMCAPRKRGAG